MLSCTAPMKTKAKLNSLPHDRCIINKLSKTVNSAKLDVSVGQLAKNMFDIFSTIGGDIITLAHLITKFNITRIAFCYIFDNFKLFWRWIILFF